MWWDDSSYSSVENRLPAFYFNYTLEDHWNMIKLVPRNYLNGFYTIGKTAIMRDYGEDNAYKRLGSFAPVTGKSSGQQKKFDEKDKKLTQIEYLYLDKIITLCNDKNIQLILIQPPKDIKNKYYNNYDSRIFYQTYFKKYHKLDFLDFSKQKLPQKYFWNIMHLNKAGSDYFSKFLQKEGINNYSILSIT